MIDHVQVGWEWMDKVLNNLINRTNAQKIIPSATVAVQETTSGTILTVSAGDQASSSSGGPTPTPDGDQAGWQKIGIMDASCNQYYMWVWGGPLK